MPVITFEMTPMTKDQKQQIAREFTDTVVRRNPSMCCFTRIRRSTLP